MSIFKRWFNNETTETGSGLFSSDWMKKWKIEINKSDEYRRKAAGWNIPLVLKFNPVPDYMRRDGFCGIYLDLKAGTCSEIRYASNKDLESNLVILSANETVWLELLQTGKNPVSFLLNGKLSLEKGSKTLLVSNASSSKALLAAAPTMQGVQNEFEKTKPEKNRRGETERRSVSHAHFKTTSGGIDFESYPMSLFQKAKIYGIWNPSDISFDKDISDWQKLDTEERNIIVHLSALFMAGEEAVTLDLLPLIRVIASEGRIEEEIFLTSFLWEEAKHTEFFSLFVRAVIKEEQNFEAFHGPFYRTLFYDKLPRALTVLDHDSSPAAQLKAAVTYNMIVEGTLAETGYEAYYKMLNEHDLLPGLREGILKLKQDESRHIAFGIYLINRLLEKNPTLKESFEQLVDELLADATNIIHEIFERYTIVPFGLEKEWFLDYALKQFQHRMEKLKLNN